MSIRSRGQAGDERGMQIYSLRKLHTWGALLGEKAQTLLSAHFDTDGVVKIAETTSRFGHGSVPYQPCSHSCNRLIQETTPVFQVQMKLLQGHWEISESLQKRQSPRWWKAGHGV